MAEYVFYDCDPSGFIEYDIQGEDYNAFLDLCVQYCASVSFCFRKTKDLTIRWDDRMEAYRIPITQDVLSVYAHYGLDRYSLTDYYEVRHYNLCAESVQILREMTDSVFSWVSNGEHCRPDDPCFFRSDGSVFFWSVIHEGECYLAPRDGEDVSRILLAGNWSACGTGDSSI